MIVPFTRLLAVSGTHCYPVEMPLPGPEVERTLSTLRAWIGRRVQVTQSLTTVRDSYNRHHTSTSIFELTLEDAGVAISGARLMLLGAQGHLCELSLDWVKSVTHEDGRLDLVEHFDKHSGRSTEFKVL